MIIYRAPGSGSVVVSDSDRVCEIDPDPVPFLRGDWSWNNFYSHSPPSADSRRVIVINKQKECLINAFVIHLLENSISNLTTSEISFSS